MVTQRTDSDRGQLLLVGAIIIATTILASVVLLNTVHSSPDLGSQTDAQSVTSTDRTVQQIQSDLDDLFLASGYARTGMELPFGDTSNGNFTDLVDGYSVAYTGIMSTDQSAVASISYNSTASTPGDVAYSGNRETPVVDTTTTVIEDADSLPRMQFVINDTEPGEEMTVRINDSTTEIAFLVDDSGVSSVPAASGGIDCPSADEPPIEIDLVYGVGEVTSDAGDCTVGIDESDWNLNDYTVTVQNTSSGPATPPDGTYAVSAASPFNCQPTSQCEDGVVNPVFEITYQNPNIVYSSQYTLYEREDR